jgi:hypothetical protein
VFTDDDEFAVIQKNLVKDSHSVEYSATVYQMIQSNKSLTEIKKAIIGIETLARTRQADANTDRQHNPMNSPQRDHWRQRHDRGSSRSPSQGSRYGRPASGSGANAITSLRSGDRGNEQSSYKKRFDGYRDRTQQASVSYTNI